MKLQDTTKGIILILVAAFGFATMNTFVKLAGDISFFQKAFFRNIIPFIFSFFFLLKNKTPIRFKKENSTLLILRSCFGTLGIVCNFYAVDNLILSDASMLGKLAPFFAILMSFLILREKASVFRIFTVIIAFVGSVFIINPNLSSFSVSIPSLVAILGSFGAGTAYTLVRKLGERGQNPTSIILFFSAFSSIAVIPFFIFDYQSMSTSQIWYLIMAGVFATIGQFAVTNAYIFAPAKKISVYDYSQVLFAALYGFFLYSEIPSTNSFIGYFIIILTGIISFLYSKKNL